MAKREKEVDIEKSNVDVKDSKTFIKDLDSLMLELNKKYGRETVKISDDNDLDNIKWVDVSSPKLSLLFGKGVPVGRIIEFYGDYSTGKSSIFQYIAGEYQRQGKVVAYIDTENGVSKSFAKSLGFDLGKCILSYPDYQEQAQDIMIDLAESQKVDLIIWDSVAAIAPKAELEGEMTDQLMGVAARNNNKFLRKITNILKKNNVTLLAVNQIRDKIGVSFGNPQTTPGGNGLKFYASIRCQTYKKEIINDDNNVPSGMLIRVKNLKNKVGNPYRECEIKLSFKDGFIVEDEWIEIAVKEKIIEKTGGWYSLPNVPEKIQGLENVIKYFRANSTAYNEVIERTKKIVYSDNDLVKIGEITVDIDNKTIEE